jgi:hypothetical protein
MEIKTIYGDGQIATCNSLSSLAVGTCGQGGIVCSYQQLVAAFGEPAEGDGYKIQVEWTVLSPDGIATIYDWKQGDCYHGEGNGTPVEEITDWSVGGPNPNVVGWVQKAITKNPMRLYARITSERQSRAGNKGGNEFLRMELSAFGKTIGYVVLELAEDAAGNLTQYLLKFSPHLDRDGWVILQEGHQKEGLVQTIKA